MNKKFAICIKNDGYPASLIVRKVYGILEDEEATSIGMLRIVDEEGEDYLFPRDHFILIALPDEVEEALLTSSS